jgi:hypothetical protein
MSVSLLQPYFLMSKTRSYAQIIIGSRLFLTAMAIHLSLRVAPLDLQQGGNSRILYADMRVDINQPHLLSAIICYSLSACVDRYNKFTKTTSFWCLVPK